MATDIGRSSIGSIDYDTVIDPRDGTEYRAVTMPDGKRWLAENLRYVTPDSECYDNLPENCAAYGRLYTWMDAVDHAGFPGWRLPTRDEWRDLIVAIGGEGSSNPLYLTTAAQLRAASWVDDTVYDTEFGYPEGTSGSGTDDYGFSMLPGGCHNYHEEDAYGLGRSAYYWSVDNTVVDTNIVQGREVPAATASWNGMPVVIWDYNHAPWTKMSVRLIEDLNYPPETPAGAPTIICVETTQNGIHTQIFDCNLGVSNINMWVQTENAERVIVRGVSWVDPEAPYTQIAEVTHSTESIDVPGLADFLNTVDHTTVRLQIEAVNEYGSVFKGINVVMLNLQTPTPPPHPPPGDHNKVVLWWEVENADAEAGSIVLTSDNDTVFNAEHPGGLDVTDRPVTTESEEYVVVYPNNVNAPTTYTITARNGDNVVTDVQTVTVNWCNEADECPTLRLELDPIQTGVISGTTQVTIRWFIEDGDAEGIDFYRLVDDDWELELQEHTELLNNGEVRFRLYYPHHHDSDALPPLQLTMRGVLTGVPSGCSEITSNEVATGRLCRSPFVTELSRYASGNAENPLWGDDEAVFMLSSPEDAVLSLWAAGKTYNSSLGSSTEYFGEFEVIAGMESFSSPLEVRFTRSDLAYLVQRVNIVGLMLKADAGDCVNTSGWGVRNVHLCEFYVPGVNVESRYRAVAGGEEVTVYWDILGEATAATLKYAYLSETYVIREIDLGSERTGQIDITPTDWMVRAEEASEALVVDVYLEVESGDLLRNSLRTRFSWDYP